MKEAGMAYRDGNVIVDSKQIPKERLKVNKETVCCRPQILE